MGRDKHETIYRTSWIKRDHCASEVFVQVCITKPARAPHLKSPSASKKSLAIFWSSRLAMLATLAGYAWETDTRETKINLPVKKWSSFHHVIKRAGVSQEGMSSPHCDPRARGPKRS